MMNLTSILQRLPPALRQPLRFSLFAAGLAGVISLAIPNEYRSEARILPADSRGMSGLGGLAAAAAAVGVSIPGQESPDAAYVDILNSRNLREALLKTSFKYKERAWLFGPLREREKTLLEYLDKHTVDRGLRELKDIITITRDVKTKLLTIAAETESPELSQQVARRLVRLLDEFVVSKAQTRGGVKAAFTEQRMKEARGEMESAENAFRIFLESNRNYQMSPDPAVRLKGLRLESEMKLRTQLHTTLAVAREQAMLEEKNDMPILNVLDAGHLPQEKSRPARGPMILLTFAMSFLASLTWAQRARLRQLLAESTSAGSGPAAS